MKVVIINQARMTSTRLPGKVLKEVMGKPLLEYQIERLQRVKLADELVIATTTNASDLPIVDLCEKLDVPYYRGSEEDVLSRYYEAAWEHNADVVVRVTSDCPLIDPGVIDQVIKHYLENSSEYDYVSNTLIRTYPRGMDTEVFPYRVLEEIFNKAKGKADREHVTFFIYQHPELYSLTNLSYIRDESHHRLTVDTPEDFELIKAVLEKIYPVNPAFTLEDCLQLLNEHPELIQINRQVQQKEY